jgi:spermidine synthase
MTAWPHTHAEMVSAGRTLLMQRTGPWIFDAEETLPPPVSLTARVQIGDFEEFGRALLIDGTVQLTEVIDPIYTPALVFPAALLAGSRARWLIIGGGDGATAREALRFVDTEQVRMVDISRTVIEQTQALIPSFWAGCQRDPRLQVEIADAWAALRDLADTTERLGPTAGVDILIYDLSDPAAELQGCNPFAASAADALYSEAAFAMAARCLRPGGLFVAQLAELSVASYRAHLRRRQVLATAFAHVHSYSTHIEPFGYSESWVIASNGPRALHPTADIDVAARLAELYTGDATDLYSPAWHAHLFALPPPIARHFSRVPQTTEKE